MEPATKNTHTTNNNQTIRQRSSFLHFSLLGGLGNLHFRWPLPVNVFSLPGGKRTRNEALPLVKRTQIYTHTPLQIMYWQHLDTQKHTTAGDEPYFFVLYRLPTRIVNASNLLSLQY